MTLWLAAAALAALFGILYLSWQSRCPQMLTLSVPLANLPTALDGLRIAHLSDLHSNCFGPRQERLLAQVRTAAPDLIVFTGDLVDERVRSLEGCLALMQGLVRIAPTYYVQGNHEQRLEPGQLAVLLEKLQKAGVRCLDNAALSLTARDGTAWLLCGAAPVSCRTARNTDSHAQAMEGNLRTLAQALPRPDGFRLLLSHHPLCCASMARDGYDLVLCGHTHGGQCRLPILGPLTLPGASDRAYVKGLYSVGKTTLYVSSGLGNSHLPLRTFNRVSWTLLTLRRPPQSNT